MHGHLVGAAVPWPPEIPVPNLAFTAPPVPAVGFRSQAPFHPVRFSLPARLAHLSASLNTHKPAGTITIPINTSFTSSGRTAPSGAPARCPGTEPGSPIPTSFRLADNAYVAGLRADSGCNHPGNTSTG